MSVFACSTYGNAVQGITQGWSCLQLWFSPQYCFSGCFHTTSRNYEIQRYLMWRSAKSRGGNSSSVTFLMTPLSCLVFAQRFQLCRNRGKASPVTLTTINNSSIIVHRSVWILMFMQRFSGNMIYERAVIYAGGALELLSHCSAGEEQHIY